MKFGNQIGVFFSYGHEDRFIAETLANHLRDIGYYPWVDFDGIMGGEKWKRSIDVALSQSQIFQLLLTPEAIDSEWVRYEIELAFGRQIPIIPLLIRSCQIPDDISAFQYIDFRGPFDRAFKDLQRALLSAVVRGQTTQAIDETPTEPSIPIGNLQAALADDGEAKLPLALVIEDSASSQDLLRDLLAEMGLNVHVARTRNEATALIQNNRYDFVTLDMQLGADDVRGQEGAYLLDLLKRYQSEVPIVMITGLDYDKNQTADFFETGRIKGMLDKPFDHQKLRTLVAAHVKGVRK
jgi:CheY-like chemotaxis protein